MTIHTMGPWEIDDEADIADGEGVHIQAHGADIAEVLGHDHFPCLRIDEEGVVERFGAELLANARLIAKAPDMRALLAELIDIEGPQPGTAEWADRVQRLLSEIEG